MNRPYDCTMCAFSSPDADTTLGHMLSKHINRRMIATNRQPDRRHSPYVQRFLDAAERGEGLSRGRRVA